MGVIQDVKNLAGDVKGHFHKLGETKKQDYADAQAASQQVKDDLKGMLHDEVGGIKSGWAAGKVVRKTEKQEKAAAKQFDQDFSVLVTDLQKVEELRKQLAAAEAEAQKQFGVVQGSAENLGQAHDATEQAKQALDQNLAQTVDTLNQDSANLKTHAQAAKDAKAAGDKAYGEHKATENAAFKAQVGDDLGQLGHDVVVDAKVGGLQAAKGAVVASEVAGGVAIALNAPYALPGAAVVAYYGTKAFANDMDKKIDAIKAAEVKNPPSDGSSESKAA